jgi:hypothetical protein
MKALSNTFRLSALLLFCALGAQAQAPASDVKQFSKEGLEFSYPSGCVLEDTSNADAQQLNLTRADSEAQFRIFVFRPHVNSPAKLAEARKVLVDGYIAATVKQFEQMGVSPLKSPVSLDVGGVKSGGCADQCDARRRAWCGRSPLGSSGRATCGVDDVWPGQCC